MTRNQKKFWLIQLLMMILCITLIIIGMSSCRTTRGYETNTKHFVGYGTYKK